MRKNDAGLDFHLTRVDLIVLCAALLTAITLFVIGTSKYGIGLTGDTMNYLALSENILAGRGFVGLGGEPFVLWPPGYSLIISFLIAITGANQYSILFALNIFSLSFILIIFYFLLKQKLKAPSLRYYGMGLLVIAPGFYLVSVFAFAEVIFIPILLLFLFLGEKWREELTVGRVIWLSVLSLILFFLKYIGIISFVVILYLILRGNRREWFRNTSLSISIAVVPAVLWLIRNFTVSGTPFGERGSSMYNIIDVTLISTETFLYWVFPFLLLLPVILYAAARYLKVTETPFSDFARRSDIQLLFTVLFISATIISCTVSAFDRLNNRLLFPAFIPLLILFLIFVDVVKTNLRKWKYQKFLTIAGLVVLIIPVVLYIRTDIRSFNSRIEHGAGGIATDEYQARLPRIPDHIFRELKSTGKIYCNNPELLYYATNLQTKKSPQKFFYNSEDVVVRLDDLPKYFSEEKSFLIWLGGNMNDTGYSPQELVKHVGIKEISAGLNYRIFEISGQK
ncbi:MAG: glycosyltransferase family 39 protein [Ignavibacteria bacterium]|nr:glycosyltransferase family 39 protein [Ignavibacteria bacterium]